MELVESRAAISDENKESGKKLVLSSGIIAIVLGLGSAGVAATFKGVSQIEDVEFRTYFFEAFQQINDQEIAALKKQGMDNAADLLSSFRTQQRAQLFADILNDGESYRVHTVDSILSMDRTKILPPYDPCRMSVGDHET